MNSFEGSFGGDTGRIDAATQLECGVCWWVYDPSRGDDTWQIPAGTAFTELPGHWRCPSCDAAQEQFMVLPHSGHARQEQNGPAIPPERRTLRERQHQLLQAYLQVDQRMRNLPVYNPQLDVQVIGLQAWNEYLLCVAVTPWCMNILLLPGDDTASRMEGTSRDVDFPSGSYSFITGQLEGIGALEHCSLFSPMEQFDDPVVAGQVARHALQELLQEPEPAALSRRNFLRGGRGGK